MASATLFYSFWLNKTLQMIFFLKKTLDRWRGKWSSNSAAFCLRNTTSKLNSRLLQQTQSGRSSKELSGEWEHAITEPVIWITDSHHCFAGLHAVRNFNVEWNWFVGGPACAKLVARGEEKPACDTALFHIIETNIRTWDIKKMKNMCWQSWSDKMLGVTRACSEKQAWNPLVGDINCWFYLTSSGITIISNKELWHDYNK